MIQNVGLPYILLIVMSSIVFYRLRIKNLFMNFQEYQEKSRKTALYPNKDNNFIYPTLGLVGEAGEVAEKIKKLIRDRGGIIDDGFKESVQKELGDVLWYLSQLATELGLNLDEIAQKNIEKLYSRLERGVINGDGDDR